MGQKQVFNLEELKRKNLLTRKEAAFYIGISEGKMHSTMHGADFPALIKMGYRVFIHRESLDMWLDQQTGQERFIAAGRQLKVESERVETDSMKADIESLKRMVEALCKQFNTAL